ncbi:hypothetical protein EBZ80_15945 [bacterium]|nr:hypothetical protein [bacterium]
MIAAVDFETYYDSEVSIGELGVYHYLRHPQSDIYMVSIATDTGIRYVGHPKDFDWSQIAGPEWTWLSHNAQFDMPVFERLQEIDCGNTRSVTALADWHDTADLAAFLSIPRSLKEASKHLLGVEVSKDTRDQMKGKRWESMSPEFRAEVERYALGDAEYCLRLFLEHGDKWPEHEREISAATRTMALRGVPLDAEALDRDIEKLEVDMWEIRQLIPWKDEPHRTASKAKKGVKMPLLSPVMLRAECVKNGLNPPNSFAQDDPEAEKFFEDHAKDHPWIQGVRDYRRAGKHLKTLETMRERMKEDGWMSYGLKYGGAHTLRDSGDSGLNMQNLPKGVVCGVDVRAKIKAPEGHTLAIVDLSQIEPRCLHWLAEDETTLQYIRQVPDLYEAQARAWGLYDGEGSMAQNAPEVRFMMKQLALGLGYGMGAKRFADVAGVSTAEATRLTELYRKKNPLVLRLWKTLEEGMSQTARDPKNKLFEINLPSGRTMKYRNVARMAEPPKKKKTQPTGTLERPKIGLRAEIPRAGKLMRIGFWGGVLTENIVQATARDVFMTQSLAIERAGIPVLMRVHDEVVCLVKEDEAEAKLAQIISIMSTPPDWAQGLPLSAAGSLSKTYKK